MAVGEGKTDSAKRSQQLQLLSAVPPYRPTALPILDERLRGTKFVSLEPKSVLNSPQQTGVDFWSLNPYIGCEFGCTYCYARYAHRYTVERAHDAGRLSDEEFIEFRGPHGWEAFEQRVFVKETLLSALERDLKKYFRSGGPPGRPSTPIVIGTATDPYQPAERRFRLTRGVLERLARCEDLNIGIITSALRRLADAGVRVGLIVAPVLPGITDDVPHLEALFQAAREAGARFVHAGPLRLYSAVRDRFLPMLEERFPHLAARYRRAYDGRSGVPRDYARALGARIKHLQARFGFPANDGMADRYGRRLAPVQQELGL